MLEKKVRFKKNHSKTENNHKGYKGNRNNKNYNKSHKNSNKNCPNQNKAQEVVSYRPKVRETKGSKKTIEVTSIDVEKRCIKCHKVR